MALDWNDNSEPENDLKEYAVYRGTTSGGPYQKVAASMQSAYMDSAVLAGTKYYYRVKAVDLNNGESGYSSEVSGLPGAGQQSGGRKSAPLVPAGESTQ